MRIDEVTGKRVLELKPCTYCDGTLVVNEFVPCPVCKGSGKLDARKPKGRNCPNCIKQASFCKGHVLSIGTKACHCTLRDLATPGQEMENICSAAPDEMWQAMRFVVYRSDRQQTIGEYLLGHGCAWSTTDYGRHKSMTDEALIADCRAHTWIQATKFAKDDGTIADHIGIFCNNNGYSVKAVFTSGQEVQADLARGLDVETGMAVGQRLASEGLNGTMLAVEYKK